MVSQTVWSAAAPARACRRPKAAAWCATAPLPVCAPDRLTVPQGEGWSDAVAEWTEQTSDVHDFIMGSYVVGNPAGIRSHPYSTDHGVNPLMYGDLAALNEPHAMGELWATTLHGVHAALVAQYGWSDDAKTNPDATGGNAMFLHLLIDALPLTPCNPTFPDARAAWIQADQNRFGGANACLLWKAFADRGLGTNAQNFQNDGSVPDGC